MILVLCLVELVLGMRKDFIGIGKTENSAKTIGMIGILFGSTVSWSWSNGVFSSMVWNCGFKNYRRGTVFTAFSGVFKGRKLKLHQCGCADNIPKTQAPLSNCLNFLFCSNIGLLMVVFRYETPVMPSELWQLGVSKFFWVYSMCFICQVIQGIPRIPS